MLKHRRSGQTALIVLLVMVVVLTIGLSLVSHSITEVSISKDDEESMRAFSAAEAGIERALQNITAPPSSINVGGITADISVIPIAGQTTISKDLLEGDYLEINLAGLSGSVGLNIRWTGTTAAIERTIYYTNGTVSRAGFSRSGTCATGFTLDTDNSITMTANSGFRLMRIRALCADSTITIIPTSGSLPVQAYEVQSKAAAGGSAESKTSAIEVSRSNPALPSIFDYILFSQGDLTTQ